MARLIAFAFGLLAATFAQAQPSPRPPAPRPPDGPAQKLAHRAYKAAQEIVRQERTLSADEITQLNSLYDSIQKVLIPGTPAPAGRLVCVSRDDDDSQPYVLAIQSDSGGVQKFAETKTTALEECESTIKRGRLVDPSGTQVFACVSRDGDATFPYQVAIVDLVVGSMKKLHLAIARDREFCQQQMKNLKVTKATVQYCGSRDNDGEGPWVRTGISRLEPAANGISRPYSNYDDCVADL